MTGGSVLVLSLIWYCTEVLASVSIGTMLVLIVRRFVAERRDRAEDARLRELRPVLFHCLDQQEPLTETLAPLSAEDHDGLVLLSRRLINALTGESRDVLVELMRSLGHVERLLADLRAGALPLRLQAASELAWFDQPEVRQALHHALDDRFYGVRLVAANSLIALGKLDSAREIVRCLTEDVDPLPLSLRPLFRQLATIDPKLMAGLADDAREPLAVLAIDAMAAAHQGIDFEQLCRIAIEHTGKNARAAALRTLGLLGADADERYRMLPEAGAQSPPGPLRSDDALRAVVARSVRRGLADRDWEVRTQAVIATQRLGLTEVIPRLLAMQSDPQWWVRFRSTQALAALQGRARSGQAPVVIPLELLEAKRLESVT